MLYSEFLTGTEATDNEWTYSEYKRIEKIYNDNNEMSKAEAYKMYQEPNKLIQDLIESRNSYKAAAISAKTLYKAEQEKAEKLSQELQQAKSHIFNIEHELERYRKAAHDLYYVTGQI